VCVAARRLNRANREESDESCLQTHEHPTPKFYLSSIPAPGARENRLFVLAMIIEAFAHLLTPPPEVGGDCEECDEKEDRHACLKMAHLYCGSRKIRSASLLALFKIRRAYHALCRKAFAGKVVSPLQGWAIVAAYPERCSGLSTIAPSALLFGSGAKSMAAREAGSFIMEHTEIPVACVTVALVVATHEFGAGLECGEVACVSVAMVVGLRENF
jgi:hypothetical protein